MATSDAGFRVDWRGCLRRLSRDGYLVGISLHFAPWDQCHVLTQPDQLWTDCGLCFSPRSFWASLSKPGGADNTQPHRTDCVRVRRLCHPEIRETEGAARQGGAPAARSASARG